MKLTRVSALVLLFTACGESPPVDPICNQPPPGTCDGDRLLEYPASGAWNAATSTCDYPAQPRDCLEGCLAGRCNEDATSWGWISVVELNDARMDLWGWNNGLRGRIAESEHWLLGTVDNTVANWSTLVIADGACSLFENEFVERLCAPGCTASQHCVEGSCVDLPAALDVGAITVATDLTTMEMTMDDVGRYRTDSAPDDLFSAGANVTATVAGDEVTGFSVTAPGVAHLDIPSSVVTMTPNTPVTISWTPADPGSRVRILLLSGPHHPSKPLAAIRCDLLDDAGSATIAAPLVTGFLERTYLWNRFSSIIRYRTSSVTPHSDVIELTVGSARGLTPGR